MHTHTKEKEKKRKAIIYKGLGNETLIYTTTILNFEQIFSLRFLCVARDNLSDDQEKTEVC